MYAGYIIKVEWGIGGLKYKWNQLMKKLILKKANTFIFFMQQLFKLTIS